MLDGASAALSRPLMMNRYSLPSQPVPAIELRRLIVFDAHAGVTEDSRRRLKPATALRTRAITAMLTDKRLRMRDPLKDGGARCGTRDTRAAFHSPAAGAGG